MNLTRALSALSLILISSPLLADEGFWRADALPLEHIQTRYKTAPDPALINKLQQTSLRLSNGCSASVVSDKGLILTNRHCVRDCLARLSGLDSNLLRDGFQANALTQEQSCPSLIADQLIGMQDVTEALADTTQAQAATSTRLLQDCRKSQPNTHCEIRPRPEREQQNLIRYKRHRDLRLVFAPEAAVSRHRGVKTFPRYALDFALLRIWQGDEPWRATQYLPLQARGPQPDELLLMAGFPADSGRLHSPAERRTLIETVIPHQISALNTRKLALSKLDKDIAGPMISQHVKQLARQEQNLRIQLALLSNEKLAEQLERRAAGFKKALKRNKAAKALAATYWRDLEALESRYREQYVEFRLIEQLDGFQSQRFAIARHLVRAAVERQKPNKERLPEYRDSALPQITQALFSAEISSANVDIASFGASLHWLKQSLGENHPIVILSLADRTAEQRAADLISQSQIDDPSLRRQLWDQGWTGIENSQDLLVKLAWQLEPFTRDIRRQFETSEQKRRQNQELLVQALWRTNPEWHYPAANHDFRVSLGQLSGWNEADRAILASTSFAGFLSQLGYDSDPPHAGWQLVANEFELKAPVNFVSSHDAVAGHSGSPIVNLNGELVGLLYDTNSYGLAGRAIYDAALNRAVSVHPGMIRESLLQVYDQAELVEELFPNS